MAEKSGTGKSGASTPGRQPASGEGEPSFDQRLARLEALVGELESGELGLEPSIERYQTGVELLKQCHAQLQAFRQRVEELTAEADSALKPFAGDPDAGA